jgi:hypothetical protein
MDIGSQSSAPAVATSAAQVPRATLMARRFRGFLPVVVDVETGGFHAATDALLEIAAVLIDITAEGALVRGATHSFHVQPYAGRAPGSGGARRQRHRPLPPLAPGAARARRFAESVS